MHDSSICKAAIHQGLIGDAGGKVHVKLTPGQQQEQCGDADVWRHASRSKSPHFPDSLEFLAFPPFFFPLRMLCNSLLPRMYPGVHHKILVLKVRFRWRMTIWGFIQEIKHFCPFEVVVWWLVCFKTVFVLQAAFVDLFDPLPPFLPHEGRLFMSKQEVVYLGWEADAQLSKKSKGCWKGSR